MNTADLMTLWMGLFLVLSIVVPVWLSMRTYPKR